VQNQNGGVDACGNGTAELATSFGSITFDDLALGGATNSKITGGRVGESPTVPLSVGDVRDIGASGKQMENPGEAGFGRYLEDQLEPDASDTGMWIYQLQRARHAADDWRRGQRARPSAD
jgi:hypothetical protein